MALKEKMKSGSDGVTTEVIEAAAPSPTVTNEVAPQGPQVTPAEPTVTFSHWFRVRGKERGYKSHWAAGMQAYTDTSISRPMTEWDEIFKAY